jgi:hypothetical protein
MPAAFAARLTMACVSRPPPLRLANTGFILALSGRASDAIEVLISGIIARQTTGSTYWMPLYLPHLARAHAGVGQFEEAWRCIGEAMTAVETTKEKWCEAEIHRKLTLMSPEPDAAKVFRACARGCASAAGKILGAPRGDEQGAPMVRSGQAGRGPRSSRSNLWLVHRRLRHPVWTIGSAHAVYVHRHGRITDRTFENQSYRASGLNLAIAAIVYWNTVYMQRAVAPTP